MISEMAYLPDRWETAAGCQAPLEVAALAAALIVGRIRIRGRSMCMFAEATNS